MRSTRAITAFTLPMALCCCNQSADDTAADPIADCGDPCALTDAQNFSYSSVMDAAVVDARAEADITLDWSALTVDILGHTLDPTTDISQVRLVFFANLEPSEVLEGLASDTLAQSDVGGYFTNQPEGSTCQLAQFGLLGSTPGVDKYFTEGSGTWLFALGTDGITGARSLVFGRPIAASNNLVIPIDNNTASLTFDVDLSRSDAVGVAAGAMPVLDWSGLTVNGVGNAIEIEKIDLLQVAHYDLDLGQMEDSFFDLPTLADQTWSLDVGEVTSASLADLTGDTPFTGIDATGTWELALWCTSCENPVPKFLAHLALPTDTSGS